MNINDFTRLNPKHFGLRGGIAAMVVVWVSIPSFPFCQAASFKGLGDLPGGDFMSVAMDVSADSQVVVGYSASSNGTEAFRWTATEGMVGLGDLPGGKFSSFANAISADGSVVVGNGRSASGTEAFRWTPATGMVPLGDLPGGDFFSVANAISANGQVIVGESCSTLSGSRLEAFRWTATEGMTGLGDLAGGKNSSRAWGVSADGSVIVGESGSANATQGVAEAFRWTQAAGMEPLGDFPGIVFNSIAYGVSADGSVVVGRGYSGAYDDYTHEAFRWTAANGLARLGFIPCSDWSIAHAASGDGSIIVGDPESNQGDCAFIWDPEHGMRNLHEVLTADYGLDLTGWKLSGVRGIAPDGGTIVGFGFNPQGKIEAWIANLKPSTLVLPALEIRRDGCNIVLSWQTNAPGYVLEYIPSMANSNTWSAVPTPADILGDRYVVNRRIEDTPVFFRLRKP